MKLDEYVSKVVMPANVAVSAMRRAGLPIDLQRLNAVVRGWEEKLVDLERQVEGVAAEKGTPFTYSADHSAGSKALADFLYRGLGLAPMRETKTGQASTDAEALASSTSSGTARVRVYCSTSAWRSRSANPSIPVRLPESTESKSFQNMVMEWARR